VSVPLALIDDLIFIGNYIYIKTEKTACANPKEAVGTEPYLVIVFNLQGFLVRSLLIDTKTCRSPHFEKFGPPFGQFQHKAQHYGKILKN